MLKQVVLFVSPLILLGIALFAYLHSIEKNDAWQVHLPGICSFSSPRAVDLNEDGVLDIVLGAGRDEFRGSDSAVVAFDGKDGRMLWHVPGRDQMVGSPLFLPIDQDAVPDVVITGRAGQLLAISGKSGKRIWSFYTAQDFAQHPDSVFLNFYGPQQIPDVDDDGRPDLLVAYGGDATIPRYNPRRPLGQLMVVSSHSGQLLACAPMPDGAETYMTPVCADLDGTGALTVIFGSGGETLGGHLYRAPLDQLLRNDLSSAMPLANGNERGFMAPPVVVDINHDGVRDIVANAVDGRILAIDGATHALRWQVHIPGAEVYGSLAVGNFTGDETPDFFTNFGRGIFPKVAQSIQLMVDGRSGEVMYRDSLGFLQIGSPLAVDIDGDGWDEALMSVNWYTTGLNRDLYHSLYGIQNQLLAFHFKKKKTYNLLGNFKGANPAATPWVGDLDGDERADIVYTYMIDTIHYQPFNGMKIRRQELDVKAKSVAWGSYMGSAYDGTVSRAK